MEHLIINLNSPQFAQALISLSDALESENYNVLISSFGLNFADGSGASLSGNAGKGRDRNADGGRQAGSCVGERSDHPLCQEVVDRAPVYPTSG